MPIEKLAALPTQALAESCNSKDGRLGWFRDKKLRVCFEFNWHPVTGFYNVLHMFYI